MRLDGDLYESTKDALEILYDKVAIGGYIYVDDYGSFDGCKRAIDEFRTKRGVTDPMSIVIENTNAELNPMYEAVWWKKTKD